MIRRRILLIGFAVTLILYYGYSILKYNVTQVDRTSLSVNTSDSSQSVDNRHQSIRNHPTPLNIEDIVRTGVSNISCINTRIHGLSFPICLYNHSQDVHVSGEFLKGSYWEVSYVERVLRFMDGYSQSNKSKLILLDIGANLGAYTLPAAHAGYNVLAIEPNRQTYQRLAKAVHKGNVTNHVKIYPVVISNTRDAVRLNTEAINRGNTYISNCTTNVTLVKQQNNHLRAQGTGCSEETIPGYLLDDLVDHVPVRQAVMKVDTQCSEIRILNPHTSAKFFSTVHVPFIFMEWECIQAGSTQLSPSEKLLREEMLQYLESMDYEPHEIALGRLITPQGFKMHRAGDIIFVKRNASRFIT